MPQENLNHIYNAGKYFESEQKLKPISTETKPSTVKRKISVVKAFMPEQEDPFKQKVEAVLKGVEPASAPAMTGGEEEKLVPRGAEVIVGTGQNVIGEFLAAGKSILVKGGAGDRTGDHMFGGEIWVEGNAGRFTGGYMTGGEIQVKGNVGHYTGDSMKGGAIYVEGEAECWTGDHMFGGEIHVKGNAGIWTGNLMVGGTLRIDGDVASFCKTAFAPDNKGTIIWKGQTIWKNGQKVEPGWTNLNVEGKIK